MASGQLSHDYIDGKYAIDTGERLTIVSRAIADLAAMNGIEFDAVGGLTMGADPLAHGVAMVTGKAWFSVRKEQKQRGREQWIEGTRLEPGTRVLLVDDVISTGGSTEIAFDRVTAVGAVVTGVIPMVDRGDVAAKRFAERNVPFVALVTYRDLGIEPVKDVSRLSANAVSIRRDGRQDPVKTRALARQAAAHRGVMTLLDFLPSLHRAATPRIDPAIWPSTATVDELGRLCVGDVPLTDIADEFRTPAYVLDETDFRAPHQRRYRSRAEATSRSCTPPNLCSPPTSPAGSPKRAPASTSAPAGELAIAWPPASIRPASSCTATPNRSTNSTTRPPSESAASSSTRCMEIAYLACEVRSPQRVLIRVTPTSTSTAMRR